MNNNYTQILEEDLKTIADIDLDWSILKEKTILISGANGFLATYMVETLIYLNDFYGLNIKIIGLVRNQEKALQKFAYYLPRNDFKLLTQDVCTPFENHEKIDIIIHAASQASPKYYGKDPVGTLSANVIGTYNLLKLAKNSDCTNFLFFSSSEVYGQVSSEQVFLTENNYGYIDPTQLRSCYAESKKMGENICISWFHQYNIPVKIVRPFHTYGPGMSLDDGRVYADFVANIVHKQDIIMKSDGSAIRAFCYLTDATRAFLTVLLKGKPGEAYNIGNPDAEISILNLAQKLVKLFPDKGLKVIKDDNINPVGYLKSQVSRNVPDITKVSQLGWKPVVSINVGFTRTVESFL